MIIVIKKDYDKAQFKRLKEELESINIKSEIVNGDTYDLLHLKGNISAADDKMIGAYSFVEDVIRISPAYHEVHRSGPNDDYSIAIGDIKIGAKEKLAIIAGPCSVESYDQLDIVANGVTKAGATLLRGGAYKPRTSPYSFQGLGEEGIDLLYKAGQHYQLPIVSEILGINDIEQFVKNVDVIQVGARNMQNYELLKALGKINKPILLKRGFASTIEEWLMSAEYIISGGNKNVILCERGIRSFEPMTRFSLDMSVIPLVRKLTHLPIIVDPSHASGNWELVEALSLAAVAAGADGLIIEVHDNPQCALSDGMQSLTIKNFNILMEKITKVAQAVGRKV